MGRKIIPGGRGKVVRNAIAQFTTDTGFPPASAAQLARYPEIASLDQSTLEELFKALTTTPNP